MDAEQAIITYLTETYHPYAILSYGSFSDGSAKENSDYDALVIADHAKKHDTSVIGTTMLDVFIYPPSYFQSEFDPEEFVQIYDAKILSDQTGIAHRLQDRVTAYIRQIPKKSDAEIRQELDWCEKMLSRTIRGDAEGLFRWHWVLVDSLMIYCDVKGQYYFGPKKTLRSMAETDAEAFRIYSRALKTLDRDCLADWIRCLSHLPRA